MKDSIRQIKYDRDKITIPKLESIGFKYDCEDNLFYNKNHFRIGYHTRYKKYQLFYGSYSNNFGFFDSFTILQTTIYYYLESEKFKLQIYKL